MQSIQVSQTPLAPDHAVDASTPSLVQQVIEVIAGLRQTPPTISSKYFYDARGSELFDQICQLPEYYLTRTEMSILHRHLDEIAACIGPGACIFEPGSGSGTKTRELLRRLQQPKRYVPIEISPSHLERSAARLRAEFPAIEISPVCADFSQAQSLGAVAAHEPRRVCFFPGSTLGNFPARKADELLRQFRATAGDQGGLLLGIDLQKPLDVLISAYDDRAGVTARFNRNVLEHLNQRFDADIAVGDFRHQVRYDPAHDRIEMWLRAARDTAFSLAGEAFVFRRGEAILTEYSHKYELSSFTARLADCGWTLRQTWTDEREWFAVLWAEASYSQKPLG